MTKCFGKIPDTAGFELEPYKIYLVVYYRICLFLYSKAPFCSTYMVKYQRVAITGS